MGSVSRGRWRKGVWGALPPTNGMASWAWLLAAVLLSLLTVSVARPPLTATKEEEATLEPEGKQQGVGRARKEKCAVLVCSFRESICTINPTRAVVNLCILVLPNLT